MAISGIIVNVIFSFILVGPLKHGGLALAYSIGGIVNLALLMYFLRRRLGRLDGRNILRSTIMTCLASAVMGVVVYFVSWGCEAAFGIANKGTQAVQLFTAGLVGVGVFFLVAKALKMPEANAAVAMVKRKLKR